MLIRDSKTTPNVVRIVVQQGRRNAEAAIEVLAAVDKCIPPYVLHVVTIQKYRSSQARIDQCIVALASVQWDPQTEDSFIIKD